MSKSLTFQEVALMALEKVAEPLERNALWKSVVDQGLDTRLKSQGKTPWETMAARLYVEIRDNPKSEVVGIGRRPVRFWLRSRPLPPGWTQEGADQAADVSASKKPKFLEKHLHPLLAHFAYEQMGGVRVRTINHSSSSDPEFSDELRRLSQAFGIGAIGLDLEDPSQGRVMLPARTRDELDWSTLDKPVAMNPDVREFVESVRIDLGARKAHASAYDAVLEDVQEYAAKILG